MTTTATRPATYHLPYLTDHQVRLLRAGITAIALQIRTAAMQAVAQECAHEDPDTRAEHIDRADRLERTRFRLMTTLARDLHDGGCAVTIPQADLDALDAEQTLRFGQLIVKVQHGQAWGGSDA